MLPGEQTEAENGFVVDSGSLFHDISGQIHPIGVSSVSFVVECLHGCDSSSFRSAGNSLGWVSRSSISPHSIRFDQDDPSVQLSLFRRSALADVRSLFVVCSIFVRE